MCFVYLLAEMLYSYCSSGYSDLYSTGVSQRGILPLVFREPGFGLPFQHLMKSAGLSTDTMRHTVLRSTHKSFEAVSMPLV